MSTRHFLTLLDLSTKELQAIIQRARQLKSLQKQHTLHESLKNYALGMIFEKSSTRTRVSFETGMMQLGGHALFLSSKDTQLGRGEPIEDSARVLSRMVDIITIRTFSQQTLDTFAAYSQVPVINALTDSYHPCQLLADMLTYQEQRGDIAGKTVTWIGDGNNMCHSYINAAKRWHFTLHIACPKGYDPDPQIAQQEGVDVTIFHDPITASENSDLITTDVWASMGQEQEQALREKAFADFQVNENVMSVAHPDCLFMHCLPAHREEEVTTAVLEGKQSVVWEQAENRLHAQKALLEFLLHVNI